MLYLVATPIGNLSDITLRALETLREVDLVASEDTRKTGLLLKHFNISKPQIAFHEYNEQQAGERIETLLKQGKSVAVVTNAGTPGIADPGFTLVRRAIQAHLDVTMIPGPTAFVMALVLSGLPVHSFTFRGFAPRKPVGRSKFLAIDKDSPHTLIFYESPYRLEAFLSDALGTQLDGHTDEEIVNTIFALEIDGTGHNHLLVKQNRVNHLQDRGRWGKVCAAGTKQLHDLSTTVSGALHDLFNTLGRKQL